MRADSGEIPVGSQQWMGFLHEGADYNSRALANFSKVESMSMAERRASA